MLPPEASALPDWLLFAVLAGGWSWVDRDRGELYAFLGMIVAAKAQGQPCRLQLLSNLAFAFQEASLCLESPICSLKEAAHAKAKPPSVVV